MALLRFIHFPSSTSSFQPKHPQFLLKSTLPNTPSFPQSLSLSLSLKPNTPNFLLFQTHCTTIEAAQQIEGPSQEELEATGTRLLAQNVNWTSTEEDIRPLFEKYGTVVDIEISMFSKTKNRGLVFVSMSSHEEALAAFSNLQSYEFMGRTINIVWAKPKKSPSAAPAQPKPVPVHNLFVANLPFKARSKDLMEFFSAENPNVVSAEIIFNEKPRGSAGYGFVSFNTKQEAEAALTAFQGKMFMGRSIRVSPSKRFLRQSTKKVLESTDESSKQEAEGEQAQTAEVEA